MWQVIGQDKIVHMLNKSLLQGRLSHAYLFAGPKHIGKMTLAINFTQALNCKSEEKPCGECSSCHRIASNNYPDVQIIQLAEAGDGGSPTRKTIGIDQIREMQQSVYLKPYEGGYRVIIIDGAEFMSEEAANSLLKTLEEPPSNTVFLLLTVETNSLLPTILSRCQRIELEPLSAQQMLKAMVERLDISPEHAELLARLSQGRPGWAISAISKESLLDERSEYLNSLVSLTGSDISERFQLAADLATQFAKSRASVREQLELWLTWWRDLLLYKSGCDEFIVNIDRQDEIIREAAQLSTIAIGKMIKSIRETIRQLEQNANPRLALEVLMLSIPSTERELSYA